MTFEIANPLEYSDWDNLLLTNEKYSFFHSSFWARVLSETYNYEPLYFLLNTKEKLQLLIPVMEINSGLTGKRGVSLPFTDCSEPIIPQHSNESRGWEYLVDYGEKAGWKYIEMRGGGCVGPNTKPSSWYYDHTLALATDSQTLFDNFRESNKRNIKKSLKMGVEVEMCESVDSMKEFYHLNCLTRRMHGLPPQPFRFFENIHKHIILKKQGLLALARYKGRAIASSIYFHLDKKAVYKYGASDSNYLRLRANNLVMWKAIEWYCQHGFDLLSFGRTDPNHDGLRQFKEGWGTRERIINYYRYDISTKEFLVNKSKVTGLHNMFFRRMPIGLLRLIGKVMYPHVG